MAAGWRLLLAVAVAVAVAPVSRAGNIDIISRLDRSFIPYSGLSSSPYPMRRYRYPIYTTKRDLSGSITDDDEDADVDKRYLRGINLRPLMNGVDRIKKMSGITPRYDISMTPYDLKAMAQMYRSGRRKRTPEVYDLKHIYRILEAGKKRYSTPEPYIIDEEFASAEKRQRASLYMWDASRMEAAGKKRSTGGSYYDLLEMARLAQAGKRSGVPANIWDLARMHQAGKRSFYDADLLDLAKMHDAGKRSSLDQQSIFDLARMHLAGKRSMDGAELWDLARMHQAGKRYSLDDQAMLDLARMHEAGKRSIGSTDLWDLARIHEAGKRSVDSMDLLDLARLQEAGKRSTKGDSSAEKGHGESHSDKKKRSFDDYFGWDRKKKSVSQEDMADDYVATLKQKVIDKKSAVESVQKSVNGEED